MYNFEPITAKSITLTVCEKDQTCTLCARGIWPNTKAFQHTGEITVCGIPTGKQSMSFVCERCANVLIATERNKEKNAIEMIDGMLYTAQYSASLSESQPILCPKCQQPVWLSISEDGDHDHLHCPHCDYIQVDGSEIEKGTDEAYEDPFADN